ncbi:MAG: hypothetical protein U0893_24405 [Chloroflexota bacterium]
MVAERASSAEDLGRRIDQLAAELVAKEAVIVQLKTIADERLQVIETLSAELTHERYLRDNLARQLEEKERMIASLAEAAEARLRFIHELNARGRGGRRV